MLHFANRTILCLSHIVIYAEEHCEFIIIIIAVGNLLGTHANCNNYIDVGKTNHHS